jgi:hypothetical protein
MCVAIAQDRKGTLRTCKHAISGWRLRLRLQVFDNYVVRIHRQLALRMQPRQLMGNQFKCAHVLCMPRGPPKPLGNGRVPLGPAAERAPRPPLRRVQLPMLPELSAQQQSAA